MTMQTSPFFDFKFGWQRGEDGWNVGMDDNIVKLSAMLKRDITGFVTVLPAIDIGEIYLHTIDKKLYYNVGGQIYSVEAPAYASYFVNGQQYMWDGDTTTETEVITADEVGVTGAALMRSDTPTEGRSVLGLGTMATHGVSEFEPAVAASPSGTQVYWNGNKGWSDFNAKSLSTVLTGFATGTNSSTVQSYDTLLIALQKFQRGLDISARIQSPTFTGIPSAPTAALGTNTTQMATTAFVTATVAAYTAPVTSVAGRTGAIVLTKTDVGLANVDNTSDVNKAVSTAQQTALNLKANLASPTFTGVPLAPTAALGTNTTQLATTAFVLANSASTSGNFMQVQDQKPSGTGGGTPGASGSNRTLNTTVVNQITGASLSGNLVTLPAGNYYLESVVQFAGAAVYKTQIINSTDNTVIMDGTGCIPGVSSVMTSSGASGYFTLAAKKNIAIRYYNSSAPTDGLGQATSRPGVEIYADLRIWKLS